MNYVIYYLNNAGYPDFAFACENSLSNVKDYFKKFYPNSKICSIYVDIDDMKEFLVRSISI